MHPIERLRYVARATHVPADVLARETAMALADFVGDDAALLIACKRILDRQPASAPLVWLVAHVLGAPNQRAALWQAVEELEDDRSGQNLAVELPPDATVAAVGWSDAMGELARRRGDVGFVIIDADGNAEYQIDRLIDDDQQVIVVDPEATAQAMFEATHLVLYLDALGTDNTIAPIGSFAAAAVARQLEIPVWGVAGVGTVLPDRMYGGLVRRWHEQTAEPLWLRPVEEVPVALLDLVVTTEGALDAGAAARTSGCPIVPELF